MTHITHIPDHHARQVGFMTWHLRKPKAESRTLANLTSPSMRQLQELEDAAHALIDGRALPLTTSSDCLNRWGQAVGMPRPISGPAATDNEAYRGLIFAKRFADTSYGTMPDVLNILRTLRAEEIRVWPIYPAAIQVQYNAGSALLPLANVLEILEAATLQIEIQAGTFTDHPFGFDVDPGTFGFDDGELGEAV